MQGFARVMVVLALMGCAPTPVVPVAVVDLNVDLTPGWNEAEPDTCGATPFLHLVGGPVDRVHTAGLPGIYRVLAPGVIVSQEYNAHRVDIQVDAKGTVTRLTCG